MKQIKCILYLIIALTFLVIHLASACYSKACPKNYRQAFVSREEFKCVATPDKSGKCPIGSVTDKVFGCRYDSSKNSKKGKLKQEYNTQMFGQRRGSTGSDKLSSSSLQGKTAGRGGSFYSGGGGGGRGGGRG